MRSPVGDALLEILARRELTQRLFAKKTGMRPVYLNDLISGILKLTVRRAKRIEKSFPEFGALKILKNQIEYLYHQS